jgi:creatinine amidohydrolase/Fe(II)-dependent formamide hydrolase-like protein
VHSVAENGVIGDPARASAEHGARYWEQAPAITLDAIG